MCELFCARLEFLILLGFLFIRSAKLFSLGLIHGPEESKKDQVAAVDPGEGSGMSSAIPSESQRDPFGGNPQQTKDELTKLERSDDETPFATEAHVGESVVAVHDNVHGRVGQRSEPRRGEGKAPGKENDTDGSRVVKQMQSKLPC